MLAWVNVLDDFGPEGELFDSLLVSQEVLPPAGFQAALPSLGIQLQGPPNTLTGLDLPAQLDLADWPIAIISFGASDETLIEAAIHTLTPVALPVVPGDYNGDGVADPNDYAVGRSTFGTTELLDADGSGNREIDAADYVIWRNQSSAAHVAELLRNSDLAGSEKLPYMAVPEPTTLLPTALALLPFSGRLRRYRKPRSSQTPRSRLRSLLAAVLLAGVGPDLASAQQPFFMGLGDLPGGTFWSLASDVSGDGSVVVGWSNGDAENEAFRWTRETGMVNLGVVVQGFAESVLVSTDGSTIVGTARRDNRYAVPSYPFRWTAEAGLIEVPFGGENSSTSGVNGDGTVIVGWRDENGFADDTALQWTPSLGVQGLWDGYRPPRNISDDGSIVLGHDLTTNGLFLQTADGEIEYLTAPQGANWLGVAWISKNGKVVAATSYVGDLPNFSARRAHRWTEATGAVMLPTTSEGAIPIGVWDVSSDGSVIVGSASGGSFPDQQGNSKFIWDSVHGSRNLHKLLIDEYGLGDSLTGWTLDRVRGISGDGRTAVGSGFNPNGQLEAWVAYLGPRSDQLAGDFNTDGTVDAADYVVWRNRNGTQSEYQAWRAHFGQTVMASWTNRSSNPVPEASTLLFTGVVLTLFAVRRRTRANAAARTIPICFALLIGSALIVGVAAGPARAQQPFFMGLGDLPGGPFFSWATDVSYDGSVVTGWSLRGDYPSRANWEAFRWTRDAGMIGLGTIGDYFTDVRISTDGSTIVGNIGKNWTFANR
jgi:probable HAF family extracellular repeat protein